MIVLAFRIIFWQVYYIGFLFCAQLQYDHAEINRKRSTDGMNEVERAMKAAYQTSKLVATGTTARREERADAEGRSNLDVLTGVYHPNYIEKALSEAMQLSRQRERALSILYVDIDQFGSINAKHGRMVGDLVLQHVAQTMQKRARKAEDWVAREDADAFVICLPGVNHRAALRFANNLRLAIMSERLPFEGDEVSLTCSFGVQTTEINTLPITAGELLRLAQEKATLAKQAGGNTVA